jgi:hypothetical protein
LVPKTPGTYDEARDHAKIKDLDGLLANIMFRMNTMLEELTLIKDEKRLNT